MTFEATWWRWMGTEELVGRFAEKPGYDLISAAAVALVALEPDFQKRTEYRLVSLVLV